MNSLPACDGWRLMVTPPGKNALDEDSISAGADLFAGDRRDISVLPLGVAGQARRGLCTAPKKTRDRTLVWPIS